MINDPAIPFLPLAIVSGCADGAKLRRNSMVDLTPKGLRFHGTMTEDRFVELFTGWRWLAEAGPGGLADLLREGRAQLGEARVTQLLEQLEFSHADVLVAERIARTSIDERMASTLSNRHFEVLGAIKDDKERRYWQAQAEEVKLSPHELAKSIAAGRIVREAEIKLLQGGDSGLPNVQSVAIEFGRWFKQIGGEEKILSLSIADRRTLQRLLEPQGKLYLKLQASTEGVEA